MDRIQIFVSYSHDNSDWVDADGKYKFIPWLQKQLGRWGVDFWIDRELRENHAGEDYKRKIKEVIDDSDIALLLVSQEFASSEFITTYELPWIKEMYDAGKIKIFPLLLTNVAPWDKKNIAWIDDIQFVPDNVKPLLKYTGSDDVWMEIKGEILAAIQNRITAIRSGGTIKMLPKGEAQALSPNKDNPAHPVEIREEIVENIIHHIVKAGCDKGYGSCTVSHYTNGKVIFDFSNEKKERTGYLVLKKEDVFNMSLFSCQQLIEEVSQVLFGKWGTDDLDNDWDLFREKVASIATSVLFQHFDANSIKSEISFDPKSISFYPVNSSKAKISKNVVLLDSEFLDKMLSMPPIQRGMLLANLCENLG